MGRGKASVVLLWTNIPGEIYICNSKNVVHAYIAAEAIQALAYKYITWNRKPARLRVRPTLGTYVLIIASEPDCVALHRMSPKKSNE